MAGVDNNKLREIAVEETELLTSCGFIKPSTTLTYLDVPKLIKTVTLHSTILNIKAELDQLIDGLDDAQVLPSIRSHPDMFKHFFVEDMNALKLTASNLTLLISCINFCGTFRYDYWFVQS